MTLFAVILFIVVMVVWLVAIVQNVTIPRILPWLAVALLFLVAHGLHV